MKKIYLTENFESTVSGLESEGGQIAQVAQPPHNATPETEGSLLEVDGTIIFIAGSFVLFTIIMSKIFYGPIAKIREKREEYIKSIKTEAETAYKEAEELQQEYSEKILAARKKVSEKTKEAMNEATKEKTRILEDKKLVITEFLNETRQNIQEERIKTFNSLKENISIYASDISKKILNEEIPIVGVSSEAIDNAINR
ncbi:MAG TPA: ATP synthase F0 subunit B [Candidatus Gastranaerophilales bacterium]|nr:ATP synthase F0 subunit B [Candidatus Gastranaerophilales bacterium]